MALNFMFVYNITSVVVQIVHLFMLSPLRLLRLWKQKD
jgi:hypothetical protein